MYTFNILCEVVVDISCCSALSVDIQKRLIRVNLLFSEVFQVVGVFCEVQTDRNLDNDSYKSALV